MKKAICKLDMNQNPEFVPIMGLCRELGITRARINYLVDRLGVRSYFFKRLTYVHKNDVIEAMNQLPTHQPASNPTSLRSFNVAVSRCDIDTPSYSDWLELCARYDNRCLCCGRQCQLSVDHILPVSKGGTNHIDNLQPLCRSCNSQKKSKTTNYRIAIEILGKSIETQETF